ncbi:MAG: tRNA lysidine(34) synthetase TilS [Clostridiales bacterium]|nr:tRNA lysidine(34) synthetase TilS [Clostridiales bacterium]
MENILKTIEEKHLIKKGEIVAVACSGGADSMALLHKLKSLEADLGAEIIAVTIDHSIRQAGATDATFVEDFCKQNKIRCYKFKVDVPKLAMAKAISLESAGREARYGIFDALLKKGVANRIAIAHHEQDQAETILLHLFRGAGLSGVRGMEFKKDEHYIRPLLNTTKKEIFNYLKDNNLEYVEDETNAENIYTRNFLRNEIFPLLTKKWPNVTNALINFSKSVTEDDDYINDNLNDSALLINENTAQIPLSYFMYSNAVINRIIFKAFHAIGVGVDIERKHVEAIKDLACKENGKKINLPLGVIAHKEYEYLTLTRKKFTNETFYAELKCGETIVPHFGKIIVKRVKDYIQKSGVLYIDAKKLPKGAMWRFRKESDFIEKFGGGTKKLKSFLIDKKIPQRERDILPVLAFGNEIFAVAGVEISEKVKVEDGVKSALKIEVYKQ